MIYKAKHRFADVAPRKMRPIANMVRGRNIDEALESLKFLPNRGARLIEAVIKSAAGNAEEQGCRHLEDLVVTSVRIDGGPTFKRIQPRARGTAFGILRRLAHIVVELTDVESMQEALEPVATTPETTTTPTETAASAPVTN